MVGCADDLLCRCLLLSYDWSDDAMGRIIFIIPIAVVSIFNIIASVRLAQAGYDCRLENGPVYRMVLALNVILSAIMYSYFFASCELWFDYRLLPDDIVSPPPQLVPVQPPQPVVAALPPPAAAAAASSPVVSANATVAVMIPPPSAPLDSSRKSMELVPPAVPLSVAVPIADAPPRS